MSRLALMTAVAALALGGAAHASGGLVMAEQWSWARDGGRILNSALVLGAALYLVVRFGRPVLRRRAELIAQRFDRLEEATAAAQSALEEYEKRLGEIEAEGEKLKEEARAEGEMIKKKIIEQAGSDSKRLVEKAGEQIAIETEKARAALRRETELAAIDLAERILKENIGPEDHKRLMELYFSGMEKRN